ncbi:glycosyltransferase [Candidatus Saccharibacteria bacterium]|nr:glycosyltransferase [Candidatus Saccharibacteria bacterium]MCP5303690.1 glycosyltransferase [Pseudomonadales bacterium]
MKIIILCKRAPQSRDLWRRPYGRFFHLARYLAEMGDEVHLVLLNYGKGEEFQAHRDGINWHSVNLAPNPLRFYRVAIQLAKTMRADWIIGFSDTYFGICAELIGRQTGASSLIDAYDNYESYIPWCKPLHWLWRRALRRCTGVTAAGPGLLKLMSVGRPNRNSAIIEMAADPQFTPGDKISSRRSLGLPEDRPIIAYSGSLYRSRGIEELFSLIEYIGRNDPNVYWMLSGRLEPGISLPNNLNHLGYVADDKVVDVVRSADVVLCVNKPDTFGSFSYPVKIYEALAVGARVVAFSTDSVEYVMREHLNWLVPFGEITQMADRAIAALTTSDIQGAPLADWAISAKWLRQQLIEWKQGTTSEPQ